MNTTFDCGMHQVSQIFDVAFVGLEVCTRDCSNTGSFGLHVIDRW
ncbi:hypothetical protein LY56_02781 [Roseinatronobacter thiooxidans]|uniref:Uncharacterized protein n=1 Tax=Roseinatronobacter thiooxidans TaxID=121821 RepID=A0A2W7RN41_9RHOB|nr:hypothetical protein LY56_02781 [Roseinatronobacter thiooxidans]